MQVANYYLEDKKFQKWFYKKVKKKTLRGKYLYKNNKNLANVKSW